LERLTDAARLRAALYPATKPLPVRRRSRQYPGGRPNPWRPVRSQRRHRRCERDVPAAGAHR
jgi:hypothetical protein